MEFVDELEQDLECGICSEIYQDPRVLNCQHIFCVKCLTTIAGRGFSLSCPVCRTVTLLDLEKGVAGLGKPITLNKVQETVTSLIGSLREKGSMSGLCSVCSDSSHEKATLFCEECLEKMCESCFDKHLAISGFESHSYEIIEEMPTCEEHRTNICKHYCVDCCTPVCVKCLLQGHLNHKAKDIKIAVAEIKDSFQQSIVSLENDIKALKEQEDETAVESVTAQSYYDTCIFSVETWRDKMTCEIVLEANKTISELTSLRSSAVWLFQDHIVKIEEVLPMLERKRQSVLTVLEYDWQSLLELGKTIKVDCNVSSTKPVLKKPSVELHDLDIKNACTLSTCLPDGQMIKADKQTATDGSNQTTPLTPPIIPKPAVATAPSVVGIWSVTSKKTYKVKKVVELFYVTAEKIYMRVKSNEDTSVLKILNNDGEETSSIELGEYQADTGITYDSLRKTIILGHCCTQGVLNKLYFNVYLVQWINTVINLVKLQTEINNI